MKKMIVLAVVSLVCQCAAAQMRGSDNYFEDRFQINLNYSAGNTSGTSSVAVSSFTGYTGSVDSCMGTIKVNTGIERIMDINAGYFIGERRHWGIGAGIRYGAQSGIASLDNFHVEYRSVDANGSVFRQLITANGPVHERVSINAISIPLLLKYKTGITRNVGIMVDAGVLCNASVTGSYKSTASFNYEGIYAFSSPDHTPYYDAAATPSAYDWFITVDQFNKHTDYPVNHIFDSLRSLGYNVGLGIKPAHNSGVVKLNSWSIGFIVRPSVSVHLQRRLYLNVGGYYSYQSITGKSITGNRLVDKMGDEYTSLLTSVKSISSTSVGLTIGITCFLGNADNRDPNNYFFLSQE